METGVALPRPEEPRRVSGGFQSDSDFRGDRDRVGALEYHGRVATWDANPQDHDVSHRPREALVKPSATPGCGAASRHMLQEEIAPVASPALGGRNPQPL